MVTVEAYQVETWSYLSVTEMMTHIGNMSAVGWTLVYTSVVGLKASYRK